MRFKVLVIGFVLMLFAREGQSQVVRVLDDNRLQDTSIGYFRNLLISALDVTKEEFGDYRLDRVHFEFSQDRSLQMLKSDEYLDVMHSMSNAKREEEFIAVKVPLLKGLMGKRMVFTHVSRLPEFEKITQLSELQSLVACQGLHWPDSDILEENGFKVARVVVFESMFDMVIKRRCDYFPRGIHEIYPELESFKSKHPDLAIVPNLIISYPAPVYYFLGKHNAQLALRIEKGLRRLQELGSFDQMIKQNPLTKHVFPLEKWQGVNIFNITNPSLPDLDFKQKAHDWMNLGTLPPNKASEP